MMLGLSLAAFTQLHVGISLIGIFCGIVFFSGMAIGRWRRWWNSYFLLFTVLTSITGFMFPPKPIGPPFVFGVISLLALGIALLALYNKGRPAAGRKIYLVLALFAQWLNMVVLVVQSYQKIPALNALAPTGAEPPLLATQGVLLLAVLYTGWKIMRRRGPSA